MSEKSKIKSERVPVKLTGWLKVTSKLRELSTEEDEMERVETKRQISAEEESPPEQT